jgi:hypothetical protein
VNKEHFIKVLQHYSGSSVDEAENVLSLKEDFPYSQVLHTLSARVCKDHGFSNQQTELQLAAVYAADRSVLKEIMTAEYIPDEEPPRNTPQTIVQEMPQQSPESDGLAEEVIQDLERLSELKQNFEMMFVEFDSAKTPVVPTKTVDEEPKKSAETPPAKDLKSRKERIVEMARSMGTVPENSVAEAEPGKIKNRRKKKDEDGNDLIDEIVSSKLEISPENDRQKEQLEIIEQFIKTQPSISSSKDKPANQPAGDLSTIKTGEFGDNIVSETLVEILVKQGKKDKAIEVLKKLIWKFPQKKAYFASQIEDLRK